MSKGEDPKTLEAFCRLLYVADSPKARSAKQALEAHFHAEWSSDIESTMATIHPDGPWQRIPSLGVDIRGYDAVRKYYLERFASWPGRVADFVDRCAVLDDYIVAEAFFDVEPAGNFAGVPAAGHRIKAPVVIIVDIKDGLVLGETIHIDGSAVRHG